MGATPVFALPYPEAADPADGPIDIRELAERIEAIQASFGKAPIVGALPGSPVDGQEIAYRVDANTLWRLRYDAAIADAYKWVFQGGPPRHVESSSGTTVATSGYSDGSAAVLQLVAPLRGVYQVMGGHASLYGASSNQEGTIGLKIGAAATSRWAFARSQQGSGSPYIAIAQPPVTVTVTTAGDVIKVQYLVGAVGGSMTFEAPRSLVLVPMRLG